MAMIWMLLFALIPITLGTVIVVLTIRHWIQEARTEEKNSDEKIP